MADKRIIVGRWDELAGSLSGPLAGRAVRPADGSSSVFSRRWASDDGLTFEIFVQSNVDGAPGFYHPPKPSPVADLGDHAVYDACHKQLIWCYRNINVLLGAGAYDQLRPLADAVQGFLATQPIAAPEAVLPRFRHRLREPIVLVVGEPLWIEVDNLQPGDVFTVSGTPRTPDREGRVEVVMEMPGRSRLSLVTSNPMTLLHAPYTFIELECVLHRDVEPERVTSLLLPNAALQPDGTIAHSPPTERGEVALVYAIELTGRGLLLAGFRGPTMVAAPLSLVVRPTGFSLRSGDGREAPCEHQLTLTHDLSGLTGVVVAFDREYRVEEPPPLPLGPLAGRVAPGAGPPGEPKAAAALMRRFGVNVPPECEI